MVSLVGKIFVQALWKFMNNNPASGNDMVESSKKLDNMKGFRQPKWVVTEKFTIGNLPVEMYYRKGTNPKKVLYFLHGGGYIGRLNGLYRNKVKEFLKQVGDIRIVFIDYRTVPEYVYPCALEDALAGWDWLIEQGYREEDIITIGDSAGGNLNLALNLTLRDAGRKMPKAMVCISPWTDMVGVGKSYFDNYNHDPMFGQKEGALDEKLLKDFAETSLYTWCFQADRNSYIVSPVFAEYAGFPPTLITVGGSEMLLSDSQTVYENMKKAGVDCRIRIDEGMFHIYPLFPSVMPEAKKAFAEICSFLSEKF